MNENIDLTKILKDCPKGWEFYSSVYGKVEFVGILSMNSIQRMTQEELQFLSESVLQNYPIQFKAHDTIYRVTSEGNSIKGMGECTFFPSKEQRDWNKFTSPWYRRAEWLNSWLKKDKKPKFDPKTLKPFDRVLVRDDESLTWKINMFSHIDNDVSPCKCLISFYKYCIPYNDDTKHLVGTTDEAPEYYRYWED